jgi:hypothetical protein
MFRHAECSGNDVAHALAEPWVAAFFGVTFVVMPVRHERPTGKTPGSAAPPGEPHFASRPPSTTSAWPVT